MAYASSSGTSENRPSFYQAVITFLRSTGWALVHEETTGNPFTVLQSPGESGSETLALQIQSTSGRILVTGYQSWSVENRQGYKPFGNSNNYLSIAESTQMLYWLFADLDHLILVTKTGSTYHYIYAGLIKSYYPNDTIMIPGPVSPGSNVTLSIPNGFSAGQTLMLMDAENIERVEVAQATDSQITVHTIAHTYPQNAKIGTDPLPLIITRSGRDDFYAANLATGYHSTNSHSGTITPSHGNNWANYSTPNGRTGKVVLFPYFAGQNLSGVGELRGELIECFAIGSTGMDSESILEVDGIEYLIFNLSGLGWSAVRR